MVILFSVLSVFSVYFLSGNQVDVIVFERRFVKIIIYEHFGSLDREEVMQVVRKSVSAVRLTLFIV